MKIAEAQLIMVPGYTNSGPNHWQSRWERKFKSSRRVEQHDWHKPVVEDWCSNLAGLLDETAGPPQVLIAHSLGCQVVVQTLLRHPDSMKGVHGAFFAAPPDVENPSIKPKHLMTFGPYPRDPLIFPSVLIASTNDRFCSSEVAAEMASCWGSLFMDAGESGHLNAESGHGPWPEGLMVFAEFMKRLGQ